MNKSESIKELSLALSKFQSEVTNPPKNRTAKGKAFSYKYADISDVLDHIRKLLAKNSLSVIQTMDVDERGQYLETILAHSSGEFISSRCVLPVNVDPQDFGAAVTYMRRYALSAIVGIAADEDTDAKSDGEGNKPKGEAQPSKPRESNIRKMENGSPCPECDGRLMKSKFGPGLYCPNCKAKFPESESA